MKYRKIFALLLAAATLFSLAACGETAAGPEATPDPALDESAATVSGQTLTFGGAADDVFSLSLDYEESLNPIKTQSTLNQLVDCLVYDRLFEVDENFNVTSRILSDWYYSKNEDSAGVWVLKVREGIQMHDGSTLTAQDVAYSVSCIFTSERHKHLQQQVGRVYSSAYNGEVYLAVEGADNAQLPQRMSIPVIKSGSVGDEIPVGSGPYMYNEDRTALVKFDGYENSESLPLDEVQLRAYRGMEELITEFESGLVDLVVNDPTGIYNMGYGGKNEKRTITTTNLHFIGFNSQSRFFQYDAYRYAMNWIVNRNKIVSDTLDGNAVATVLPVHPNSALYDTSIASQFSYDPSRCLTELERGGCRDLDADGMLEFALSGMKVDCVCPHGYRPAADVLMFAHKYGSAFRLLEDPAEGVKDADVVVTAVWNTAAPGTSESESRLRDFAGFQLTGGLLKAAKPDCMVLHCLPAHRGEEISTAVFEAHADEIFTEAENRLHVQKAVLAVLLAGK